MPQRPPTQVVVVGGGFGGLEAVKALARAGVEVTLIDRHNYHLFQPLTYQVATGGLAPGDIAIPLRHVVRGYPNVDVLLGQVTGFDVTRREVVFDPQVGAAGALEELGVTLLLEHAVVGVHPAGVELRSQDGQSSQVSARTVIWAAGVTASPLARMLGQATGAEVDRSGRVAVEPDLSLPGHPEVMALGDMVRVRDPRDHQAHTLPGLAPVAMQQGRYAGRAMAARMRGQPTPARFHYRDKGALATIGRARAVAELSALRFSGFPAWLVWLVVHIFYLIGFENRVVVMLRWAYAYFTRGRGNRLITSAAGE